MGRTYTSKAVTANSIKRASTTVAFASSTSLGSVTTSVVNGALLRDKSVGRNYPVQSAYPGNASAGGTFGYIGKGEYIIVGYSTKINGTTGSIFKSGIKGTDCHKTYHSNLTIYSRHIGYWNYATGKATNVTSTTETLNRDDAVYRGSNNGEFVFIPAGGRLPAQGAGNAKYYTYTKTY